MNQKLKDVFKGKVVNKALTINTSLNARQQPSPFEERNEGDQQSLERQRRVPLCSDELRRDAAGDRRKGPLLGGRCVSELPIGKQVSLPGHFDVQVILEAARPLGKGFECRVRLPDGSLDEAVISAEEAAALAGAAAPVESKATTVNAEQLRLLVESARIRLAYAHDKHFAVSLSGIRTLPHQIEAVYIKMLPQPRLRFLLADDPGAGKTIMAGLLIKEMKLREAIERVLNREQLRLVAQALAGPALKGGELGDVSPTAELSALAKLTANWQSVVEGALVSDVEQADRRKGQERLL